MRAERRARAAAARRARPAVRPSAADAGTEVESLLAAAGCETIAGVDEVGRGAWAGPLTVGVAVAAADLLIRLPSGIRDSKALSPEQRKELVAPIAGALLAHAFGHATPAECDRLGMTAAQRLATARALASVGCEPDAVILDGPNDFTGGGRAVCVVDGDRLCVLVAAASVLAKVRRDSIMIRAGSKYPGYSLERNKGYASLEHRIAVGRLGLTRIHRQSWAVMPLDGSDQEEIG